MEFQPTEDRLTKILELLKDIQSLSFGTQRKAQEKIHEMNDYSDFNHYLMLVLTKLKQEDDCTRSVSGMILKDNIRSNYKTIHSDAWTFIKQECLNGIGDQSFVIRATNCVIISTVLERMGLHFWPELLPTLCEFLNSCEHSIREGASAALKAVCEVSLSIDTQEDVVSRRSVNVSHMLTVLIPKFIQRFKEASPKTRIEALENVDHFNDIIELVQRFSTPEHSLIAKIEYISATKGKSLKLVSKDSRLSHKRGKRSKSNKLCKTQTNKLHKGKAVTKTVSKQNLPRANTAKIKEKGKRKLPLKSLRKVHKLLREKTSDATLSFGPLKKLNWSDWFVAICHRNHPSITTSNDFNKSSIFGAYHRKSLFNKDMTVPAVYEIGVKNHAKFKRKIHVMLIRTCKGYRGKKNLIAYLLYNKNVRKEVKRLLRNKFEVYIRRGVAKNCVYGAVVGLGRYIRDNYDYAWHKHGKDGHRKVTKDGVMLSDPLL